MSGAWRDRITGARMQVDREFQSRVRESQFSNQQWGLIMTAVELRIDNPENPAEATLVADTEKVEHIMPELENIPQGMGARPDSGGSQGGGLLGKLRGLFGGGSDEVDPEKLAAAGDLADEYARELQAYLEAENQWKEICRYAAQT